MFQCLECTYETNKKYNLQEHYKRKHQKEVKASDIKKGNDTPNDIQKETNDIQKESNDIQKETNDIQKETNDLEIKNKQEFICEVCLKIYKTHQGLKKHNCTGTSNSLQCPHCNKEFTTRGNKSRHLKICKIKEAQLIVQEYHKNNPTVLQTHNQIQNNNDNRQQIIYNIYTGKVNDTYESDDEDYERIERNDFCKEVTDYISPDTIQNLATNLNVCRLIELKHFNPDHPENHNIRQNDKDSYKVLRNQKWEVDTKENVLTKLYNLSRGELYVYSIDNLFNKLLSDSDTDDYISRWVDYDKRSKKRIFKYMEVQLKEVSKKMNREIKKIREEENQNKISI